MVRLFDRERLTIGNGVTVAFRFLGQAVDIAKVVFQSASLLIRLFPDTSGRFAKPAAFTEALSLSWRQILGPTYSGQSSSTVLHQNINPAQNTS
jgi:hypothetical protein